VSCAIEYEDHHGKRDIKSILFQVTLPYDFILASRDDPALYNVYVNKKLNKQDYDKNLDNTSTMFIAKLCEALSYDIENMMKRNVKTQQLFEEAIQQ
jgi:hypothetical protein